MKIIEHAEKRAEDLKLLELVSKRGSRSDNYTKGYRAGYRDALADVIEDLLEDKELTSSEGGTLAH